MYTVDELAEMIRGGECTVAIAGGDVIFTSRERGVKPLLDIIERGECVAGYVAADKIVGKAAALLYAYMGVKEIYALVASESAQKVCASSEIRLRAAKVVPAIINRRGDGICPMEEAVADLDEPQAALAAIKEKIARLRS